jgi:uncharacterized protein (TIGR02453 family)
MSHFRGMTTSPVFAGFSKEALKFLRDLARHNDRQWFTPRKHIYETELQEPLRALVADASIAMQRVKIPLSADLRRSTFRIYRDIRFSPDKSPYKTNIAAFFAHNGNHDTPGGLYIHIQPKNSFIVSGFYQIDKPLLQRWREEMARSPKSFESLLRTLERTGLHLSEDEGALKRMPRGFEAYAELSIAKYFRYSSFMISERASDEEIESPGLLRRIVEFAKRTRPLLDYGWRLK